MGFRLLSSILVVLTAFISIGSASAQSSSLPDLQFTALSYTISGRIISINYAVTNMGISTANSTYIGFAFDKPVTESTGYWGVIPSLPPGQTHRQTSQIDVGFLGGGNHILALKIDYWMNLVSERNESNNDVSIPFLTADVAKADLRFTAASYTINSGKILSISYSVTNTGSAASNSTYIGFAFDGPVTEAAGYYGVIPALRPGQTYSQTTQIYVGFLSQGDHGLSVKIDYWMNLVPESNETNNELKTSIPVR